MKTFKSGDYACEYDDTLVKGDLITTYNSGFYEFDHSEDRGKNDAPLYYFRQKYDAKGKPRNSKELLCCDAAYCRRAEDFIEKSIKEHELTIERLKSILKNHE
jgi:hypothetical protein